MSDQAEAPRYDRKVEWIARLGSWLIRLLALTWRVRVVNGETLAAQRAKGSVALVLWHGQMLPILWQHRNQGIAILISEHRDGEIIARIAMRLGCRTVRGSTSRGAGRALIEMTRVLRDGGDIAVTPDGPRGPYRSFAPGALIAASRSGAPLVGILAHASRAWRFRSWDRFMVPKPFARVTIAYTDPMVLGGDVREATGASDAFVAQMDAAERAAGA